MSTTQDGGPAFPSRYHSENPSTGEITIHHSTGGMTLRDWFAGQALSGLTQDHPRCSAPELAADAYAFADAMMEARRKPITP